MPQPASSGPLLCSFTRRMPRLELLQHIAERGHEVNEDVAGCSARSAWVIDGASSFEHPRIDSQSDARWLATTSDAVLRQIYHADESTDPRRALEQVIRTIRERIESADATFDVKPSAAISMMHLDSTAVTIVQLGDVLVMTSGQMDGEMSDLQAQMDAERQLLTSGDMRGSDARLAERMRITRQTRTNVEGGYWVLSDDVAAVDQARVSQVPIADGDDLFLCSDGFARIVFWFHMFPDWHTVIDALKRGEGDDIVRALREREVTDPSMASVPPATRHDDATALLLRVVS